MAGEWIDGVLADACSSIDYGLTASASDHDVGPRFLRITDIVTGHIDWNAVPHVPADEATARKYRLHHGDIVLARTGASTGASAYVQNPPPAVFASYLVRLQAKPEFDARYLAYYLRTEGFWTFIRGVLGDKSAQPNASASTMTKAPLRAPKDKDEQRAIAHILGTLDDKIELNRRMNETLEAMAQALFKSWFVDFDPVHAKAEGRDPSLPLPVGGIFPDSFDDSELGPTPQGWELTTLSAICEKPQYGYTASASEEPVGPRFLRITDINKRKWIEWDRVPFCVIDSEQRDKYALSPGDIVIARMADPGHGALVEEKVDAVFASYLIRFRPLRSEFARYLQYWLRSDSYWDTVRSMQSGTTRANLNATVLGSFRIAIPPSHVLRVFDQSVTALRDRVVANVSESHSLVALRDSLLRRLIPGKVRIEDGAQFLGDSD